MKVRTQQDSVVITGIGPVSAIGCDKEVFWESLLSGRSGITNTTLCDTSRVACKLAAEVKDADLRKYFPRTAVSRKYPRAVELAIAAAAFAIRDAGLDALSNTDRMGVFVGTSVANLAETFSARENWVNGQKVRPDTSFYVFNHSAACLLSSLFDLRGPTLTISTGCNSGLDAIGHACRAIQCGSADAMLVTGTDCEIFPEIMAALGASDSLSTRYNDAPEQSPRPFDADRDGVVLGEGAAALILESETGAKQRGAQIYARISGYAGCAAGKNRVYSPSPHWDIHPSVSAMQNAMKNADLRTDQIDLVHANGSGSVSYDRLEAQAIATVFGSDFSRMRVHSIKSMVGLPGGAASALQAITACLCLEHSKIPPTINHENCDPECGAIRVVCEAESVPLQNILVHTIGLGGFYYSAAVLSSV